MKKTTVQIKVKRVNQITFIPIDGYQITPHLAVHKSPTKEYIETLVPATVQTGPWRVTHTPTGMFMFECPTRKAAVEVVGRIKDLFDWGGFVQTPYSLEFHQVCYQAHLEGLILSHIPNPEHYKVV